MYNHFAHCFYSAVICVPLLFLSLVCADYQIYDFKNIRVGGVFETAEGKLTFLDVISKANTRRQEVLTYEELLKRGVLTFDGQFESLSFYNEQMQLWGDTRLVPSEFIAWDLLSNVSKTLKELCYYVFEKNQGVHVILWDLRDAYVTTLFLQMTSQFRIPVVLTNFREEISESLQQLAYVERKSETPVLRMQPSIAQEMTAILHLMEFYNWPYMVLIARNGENTDVAIKIIYQKLGSLSPFEHHCPILFASKDSIASTVTAKLHEVRVKNKVNIFVVLADSDEAEVIFSIADRLKLFEPKYVWIVSETIIDAPVLPVMPEGMVGFKAKVSDRKTRIEDAVKMIIKAHRSESSKGEAFYVIQKSCLSSEFMIHNRKTLTGALLNTTLLSEQGLISFDKEFLPGHRKSYSYTLVNLQKSVLGGDGLDWKPKGEFFVSLNESLSLKSIKWIGGSSNTPSATKLGGSFRLVSVHEEPFIKTSSTNHTLTDFPDIMEADFRSEEICSSETEVVCLVHSPQVTSSTILSPEYTSISCCTGVHVEFILDLIDKIYDEDEIKPHFTFHVLENTTYGLSQQQSPSEFSGILGKVKNETFDLVFGPICLTADRTRQFDFSQIYYWSNLVVITKRRAKISDPSSILRPFSQEVWYAIAMAVCVVSVSLWIVEKYSPFGNQLHKSAETPQQGTTDLNQFNASSSGWYTMGVLLGVSLMSLVPRATSSKIISLIWSIFCLVALTTYTANLAAFMVSEQPNRLFPLGFFKDERVLNPTDGFVISTVCDSYVIEKFQDDPDYSKLYQHLVKKCVPTPEEGFQKVKRSEVNAFLWDSGSSMYRILSDVNEEDDHCQLTISEFVSGSGGYAIAGDKGNPFVQLANIAILSTPLTNFEATYEKWLPESSCEPYERKRNSQSNTLFAGYTNQITAEHATGILYVLVAGMILGGVVLPLETHFHQRYSNYFKPPKPKMLCDMLLPGPRGVLITEKERNDMLTQKLVQLRHQKDALNNRINHLQLQIETVDRENDQLRLQLLSTTKCVGLASRSDIDSALDEGEEMQNLLHIQ